MHTLHHPLLHVRVWWCYPRSSVIYRAS